MPAQAPVQARPPVRDPPPVRARPLSFARLDGRLNARHERAWDAHHDRFVLEVPRHETDTSVAPGFRLDAEAAFGRCAPLVVEVGSGSGDAVVHAAQNRPDTSFLAVEVYRPGVAQTVARLAHRGLTNVRVVRADALDVLRVMLMPGSVAEVWTFFPDPWPKTRHHKRRLVTARTAALVSSRLAPGGAWRMATDSAGYARQMRDVAAQEELLENPYAGRLATVADPLGGFSPRFEGRALTRFERKALAAGRVVLDLELRRR